MMEEPGPSGDGELPVAEAISWIEAALQAGLGGGVSRAEQLREAIEAARPPDDGGSLDSWLQNIAAELHRQGSEPTPEALARAVAAHLRTSPADGIDAHRRIDVRAIRNLVPPG